MISIKKFLYNYFGIHLHTWGAWGETETKRGYDCLYQRRKCLTCNLVQMTRVY